MVKLFNNGFTLIELLIVLSIVSLLMTISLPRYYSSIERSKEIVLRENLNTMRSSIEFFKGDKGRYPINLNELVENKYLKRIPTDPITDSNQTWIEIKSTIANDGLGVFDVKSGAQGLTKDGTPFSSL